ncbi:thioredoxin-related transmembrane protein 2 homolog [Scaptodrosophila lebanonensis]|uniref:Thioredoxin-related transmembrane protein 2 homolog n=1 Tax=Drosophila lebanonensis TaxID=7225 RepID=A0A6J2UAZ3_DROLE|nr:thioredoxin-related transmembrane protein 2 homolog [Scaptodrosophila lebanonensis]
MTWKKQLTVLAQPYYWVNILLAISYLLAKKAPLTCRRIFHSGDQEDLCDLDSRETEILFFLLIVVMIRSRKTGSVTMINYLSSSFLYTKVANAILWAYADYRYGVAFLLLCVLVGMLLPEPSYRGPEHITYFRNAQVFEEELDREKRVSWLICFYTVWNPSCVNFAPIFAELSAEYNTDLLKFGKIDIGRFPDVAQKFRISDSSFSRQLPTVVLFQLGKEVDRRPCVDAKGKLQKFFFSSDNMRATFGLNQLYKQAVERLPPAKQVGLESKKSQ